MWAEGAAGRRMAEMEAGGSTLNAPDPPYRRRSPAKGWTSAHEADGNAASTSNKSAGQLNVEAIEKIDVYGSAFLLLLYMSKTRWDYVTEIAKLSAKEVGLTMDVNKLALQ